MNANKQLVNGDQKLNVHLVYDCCFMKKFLKNMGTYKQSCMPLKKMLMANI